MRLTNANYARNNPPPKIANATRIRKNRTYSNNSKNSDRRKAMYSNPAFALLERRLIKLYSELYDVKKEYDATFKGRNRFNVYMSENKNSPNAIKRGKLSNIQSVIEREIRSVEYDARAILNKSGYTIHEICLWQSGRYPVLSRAVSSTACDEFNQVVYPNRNKYGRLHTEHDYYAGWRTSPLNS